MGHGLLEQGDAVVEAITVEQFDPGVAQGVGGFELQALVVGEVAGRSLQLAGVLHAVSHRRRRPAVPLAAHLTGQRLICHLPQERVGDLVTRVLALTE